MKKLLLVLLVLLSVLFTLQTQASHLMGGQITSRNLGGLYYEVTLTLYRDSLGIPMGTQQIITYTDSSGNFTIAQHFVNYDTTLTTNIGNGVERYVFVDTITFPFVGKFKASMNNCCRNAAILNLPNPSQNSLWLDVDITADSTNSSPVFLNEPITVAQLNQPFSYNPLPFDIDGDSLSWQLDIPYDILNGTTIGSPISGYVLPPSDTLAPFSIDPLTGEITFIPIVIGNFQVSVKAIEWRNGIQIGYIRRDMQLLVVPSGNTPVQVQVNTSVQRTTTNPIYINVGETLTFNLNAFNVDNGSVSVITGGSALLNTSATSYLATVSNNEIIATINWTPTLNEVNNTPYYLAFRVGDYSAPFTFYNDYTFRVIVTNNTTGVNEVSTKSNKQLIKSVDMLGRDIDSNQEGFRINIYSDGTKEKLYIKK
jgi:hypothetical protein